jgi:hypothetical protein
MRDADEEQRWSPRRRRDGSVKVEISDYLAELTDKRTLPQSSRVWSPARRASLRRLESVHSRSDSDRASVHQAATKVHERGREAA